MEAGAHFPFSLVLSPRTPWDGIACVPGSPPALLKALWKHPHKHAQTCVSMVILNPITKDGQPDLLKVMRPGIAVQGGSSPSQAGTGHRLLCKVLCFHWAS